MTQPCSHIVFYSQCHRFLLVLGHITELYIVCSSMDISRNNNCHWEMTIHVFPDHISPSLMFVTAHWAYQDRLIFNCSVSVHLHFVLECSSVFTYLYMAHGCAIPSVMFYQHMCILFMKLSEFLNHLSRFHFHLANESPHRCLLSISVHQY